MRRKLIAANWKMNKTIAEAEAFAVELAGTLDAVAGCDLLVFPPFFAVPAVARARNSSDWPQANNKTANVQSQLASSTRRPETSDLVGLDCDSVNRVWGQRFRSLFIAAALAEISRNIGADHSHN